MPLGRRPYEQKEGKKHATLKEQSRYKGAKGKNKEELLKTCVASAEQIK